MKPRLSRVQLNASQVGNATRTKYDNSSSVNLVKGRNYFLGLKYISYLIAKKDTPGGLFAMSVFMFLASRFVAN